MERRIDGCAAAGTGGRRARQSGSVRRGAVADDGVVVSAGRPRDWRGWIGNGNRSGHGDCDRRAAHAALARLGARRARTLSHGRLHDHYRLRRARERAPARCRARQSSPDAGPDWHRGRSVGGRLALVGWQRVVGRRGFRLQPQRALSPICCRGAGNRAGREATADAGDSRPAVDRRAEPGKPL